MKFDKPRDYAEVSNYLRNLIRLAERAEDDKLSKILLKAYLDIQKLMMEMDDVYESGRKEKDL